MAEIVFILEPDARRCIIESSQADVKTAEELNKDLGQGSVVNCVRPKLEIEVKHHSQIFAAAQAEVSQNAQIYLYRIYHHSTVDGLGRRSVIQVAGCSIRCPGCYIPETYERKNGQLVSIAKIVDEIKKRSGEHDGITILGGEPFDQTSSLEVLVEKLKEQGFQLTIYTGFTLESLLARNSESVNRILAKTDLLIDGAFDRTLTKNAGEYRGSSNQRLIFYPMREAEKMNGEKQKRLILKRREKNLRRSFSNFSKFVLMKAGRRPYARKIVRSSRMELARTVTKAWLRNTVSFELE